MAHHRRAALDVQAPVLGRERTKHEVGIGDIDGPRRIGPDLGGVEEMDHELPHVVRIGRIQLAARMIDPVEAGASHRVRAGRRRQLGGLVARDRQRRRAAAQEKAARASRAPVQEPP
jgi:hypothetical protein